MTVVGIDACRGGWIAVVLDAGGGVHAVQAATLADIAARVPEAEMFGVDMPIGLSADGPRAADQDARRKLGARWPSVFLTPVRQALTASSYDEANEISIAATGKGISRQAFALVPKILEAAQWAERHPERVREVHPEVSFAQLLGAPAQSPKKTWLGMRQRLDALTQAGIVLDSLVDGTGLAAADDVLDAAVAAWTAARIVRGEAVSLPDPPEVDPQTGRAIAIWA